MAPSLIPADLEIASTTLAGWNPRARASSSSTSPPLTRTRRSKGALTLERSAERVEEVVARFRQAVGIPLWVKLTGQAGNVTDLAKAARAARANAVILAGRYMALVPDVETMAPVLGTNAAFGGPWALPIACRWLADARTLLPVSQRVDADTQSIGELLLRQTDESSENDNVLPTQNLAADDALALLPGYGPRENLPRSARESRPITFALEVLMEELNFLFCCNSPTAGRSSNAGRGCRSGCASPRSAPPRDSALLRFGGA